MRVMNIMGTFPRCVLIALLLGSCAGCDDDSSFEFNSTPPTSQSTYRYVVPPQTSDGWQTTSLSSVGMNEQSIVNLAQRIQSGTYREVHSVVIIKDGRLVFEEYWTGHDFGLTGANYHGTLISFDRNTRHNTHSATKSVTSAVVGLALDQGYIQSVNDTIFRYLPHHQDLRKEGRENITIQHLLTMASGLQWNEQDVAVSSVQDVMLFNQSANPIRFLLSKPLVSTPGTRFYYNGGTVDLLGVIVANATGESVPAFSHRVLFAPLGVTNYNWIILPPSGITACHGDIYITPRDMAKVGQLFLNNGIWNGNRVISQEWIQRSTQRQISPGPRWGTDEYGYLWWLCTYRSGDRTYNAFRAHGWGGQQIIVIRHLNMVVVFTGANYTTAEPCNEMMQSYILASM